MHTHAFWAPFLSLVMTRRDCGGRGTRARGATTARAAPHIASNANTVMVHSLYVGGEPQYQAYQSLRVTRDRYDASTKWGFGDPWP